MELTGTHLLIIVFELVALVFLIIVVLRFRIKVMLLNQLHKLKILNSSDDPGYRRRSYPRISVFQYRTHIFLAGLLISIALVYSLFQWVDGRGFSYSKQETNDIFTLIEVEEIPQTIQKAKPIPKIPVAWQEILMDSEPEILDPEEELLPLDDTQNSDLKDLPPMDERKGRYVPVTPPITPVDESPLWVVAEDMPRFPGCENRNSKKEKEKCAQEQLLAFIYAHIQYPTVAIKNGIEGTAVVTFVIETDGTVRGARVVREIGARCGEEALRVVELMNDLGIRWIPGKQNGKPVRVQYNLPVKFKLQ